MTGGGLVSFCNLLDGEGWFKDIGLDEILASEDMPAYYYTELEALPLSGQGGPLASKEM